jgi:sacsin
MTTNAQYVNAKSHIYQIYERFNKCEEIVTTLANLSNTVIETALSGQNKYLFEILQNADDSPKMINDSIEISFILDGDYFIINHTGQGFDWNDVKRVCNYASLIKEVKSNDLSKTGYKGLGFKSLFNLSDCIYIVSNGYSFRFDKDYWDKPEMRPWQIIPIWTEDKDLPLIGKYVYKNLTTFILKINSAREIANQLEDIKNKPELLLFLHHVDRVKVKIDRRTWALKRKMNSNAHGNFDEIVFYVDNTIQSRWLLNNYEFTVNSALKRSITVGSQYIFPDKIKNAKAVICSFAVKLDNPYKTVQTVRGTSFATLPTQVSLGLPYHINSSFILTLDRAQFHENEWNDFIFRCFGSAQLQLLHDIANTPFLKNQVVLLFRDKLWHSYKRFVYSFNHGFTEARGNIAWIPAYMNSKLLKLGEACVDVIEFFKKFDIRDPIIKPSLVSYDVINAGNLCEKNLCSKFGFGDLLKNLPTKYLAQLYPRAYKNFLIYFCEKSKYQFGYTLNLIKSAPFLITKSGVFETPESGLLEANDHSVPSFMGFDPIDKSKLPLDERVFANWLIDLGIKQLTFVQVFKKRLIEWIEVEDENLRTHHIEILRYLGCSSSDWPKLDERERKYLEKLPILTKSKLFRPIRESYLCDSKHPLISIVSEDELVDNKFYTEQDKKILVKIGIKYKLTFQTLYRQLIERLTNEKFAQNFWPNFIHYWQNKSINQDSDELLLYVKQYL